MLTAITGINWGDEGKGRMVDLVAGILAAVVVIGGAAWYANAKSADGSDAKGKTKHKYFSPPFWLRSFYGPGIFRLRLKMWPIRC